MAEENEQEKNKTVENLEAVGQIILGEVEKIGGILTGDPVTQAEGDYNIEAGNLHYDSSEALAEDDGGDAAKAEKS
ncbi:MAG: hypothetical protein LUM44_14600 [Pyrinomonadaceae bacterium]|nr:hypothetical protein [Pyrinomonadaceae bacterium]